MSVVERLNLIDLIWETLENEDAGLRVSPEDMKEMRRRAAELDAHPEKGISHEEMMRRLRNIK
jgi:putative addiction module component (TIGR02574 family)